jgi:PAS domain S-box-containing protein
MKNRSPATSVGPVEPKQGLLRLALLYLSMCLLWIALTAGGLILAEVSGTVAACVSAISTALLLAGSTWLFFRWQAGTLRAVGELVGLPGGVSWADERDDQHNRGDDAAMAGDDSTHTASGAGSSSERLGKVAAVVPGVLFCYQIRPDGRTRYLYVSDGIDEIYGLSAAELCAAQDAQPLLVPLFAYEDRPRLRESWARALRGPFVWHCEFRVRHPRRGEIWVEGRAAASDANGTLWYGFLADVTARKEAEAELRRSEELCRVLVEHNTDAIFLHGEGGVIEQVNSAAEAMLGYSAAELLGKKPEFFDPRGTQLIESLRLADVLSRGETASFDSEHRRKDGSMVPVEVRIKSFNSAGRRLSVSSVRDISERKHRELALQESENRLRKLADLVPGVVWCQRGAGPAVYISERWFEYTGTRGADEETLRRIVHPDDLQLVYGRFRQAAQAQTLYRCEYRLRHIQGGEYHWFLAYAMPQIDAGGEIEQWFGLAINIDELKRSEAALREERDRFERFALVVPGVLHTYRMSADGQASFPYASASLEATLGLTAAELADFAARPQDYIHADDLLRVALTVQESAMKLAPYRDHYRFRHPHKGEIWIEIHSAPVREADGTWRVIGYSTR